MYKICKEYAEYGNEYAENIKKICRTFENMLKIC
jgi:hypothetical protein